MQSRMLGTLVPVTPLAFGGNVFGWTVDEAQAFDLLDQFVAAGGNLIDTADIYSYWAPGASVGDSETIIGNWLQRRGRRDDVVIITKLGKPMGEGKQGLAPKYMSKAIDASLRRLRTDYVDVYMAHEDDAQVPLEDALGGFSRLIEQGKIRSIGASNYGVERFAEALAVSAKTGLPRYEVLQPEYNLYDRQGFEVGLQPLCREQDISVVPYYALASGFLTGKYRGEQDLGQSQRGGAVGGYLNQRGLTILAALDHVAAECKASVAQVSLAWLRAQDTIAAPIASATSQAQLEELFGSLQVELDADMLQQLDTASADG